MRAFRGMLSLYQTQLHILTNNPMDHIYRELWLISPSSSLVFPTLSEFSTSASLIRRDAFISRLLTGVILCPLPLDLRVS